MCLCVRACVCLACTLGRLFDFFLLVCLVARLRAWLRAYSNAWMQDLSHANEYVRGSTLRFLCKIREPELLQPLVSTVTSCLKHRHPYVKRNALMAIMSIYGVSDTLIPDAPELVRDFLNEETDEGARRNGFVFLSTCAPDVAVRLLASRVDEVPSWPASLQLAVIELVNRVYRHSPAERSRFILVVTQLLDSASPAVQYEAAITLTLLSVSPSAIKAVTNTLVSIAAGSADNNVKLIVLDRLAKLKDSFPRVLQDNVMDVLRVLASPNLDVRKRVLDIALSLVAPKNIDQVILFLKKEVQRTQADDLDNKAKSEAYANLLVRSIHTCARRFPEIAGSVIEMLADFVGTGTGGEVMTFLRLVVQEHPDLRTNVLNLLRDSFGAIQSAAVMRSALWLLAEFAQSAEEIADSFKSLRAAIGDIPFFRPGADGASGGGGGGAAGDGSGGAGAGAGSSGAGGTSAGASAGASVTHRSGAPKLNSDGTYATQSAISETHKAGAIVESLKTVSACPIREFLFQGEWFLAAVLATSLTKLVLKARDIIRSATQRNAITAEIMLILTSILKLGQRAAAAAVPMDADASERVVFCLRVLSAPSAFMIDAFLRLPRATFGELLDMEQAELEADSRSAKKVVNVHVDDVLDLPQLRRGVGDVVFDDLTVDLYRATGQQERSEDSVLKLDRVFQLTGFSDPVYAEAYVHVHQYDIAVDVLIVNQTSDTLSALTLVLATLGDLRVVEKPQVVTIGPRDFRMVSATLKVSSTETGIIFGEIEFDVAGASANDKSCVVLNDIHIDVLDYIMPATCSLEEFRAMYAEFEWENKVQVATAHTELAGYLDHIVASTNMKMLTPREALEGDASFLSANLYARSIFGEAALANVSIERSPEGKISGYVRIRSKTQGIALSLGDRITLRQKG